MPAVACDVLPSMQTKKIKNIFCSVIQKAEGFQEACQEIIPIQILGVAPPPHTTHTPPMGEGRTVE